MRLALLALLLTGVIGCGLESGRPAEDWKSDTENGGAAESDSEFTVTLDAAENGDAAAQRNLANMYRHGQGVAKDNAEAEKWYRRAAEQGDAEAQYNLGVIYRYGRGVPKDNTEAVKWYRKAAEQGDTKGQFVLGNMYYDGRGVPKDQAEAVKWWRKAAE